MKNICNKNMIKKKNTKYKEYYNNLLLFFNSKTECNFIVL